MGSASCSSPDFSTNSSFINVAIDAALLSVDDDSDVIIICAGVYAYDANITIYDVAHDITIRADLGADITLDGSDSYQLLRFGSLVNSITISGITFQDSRSGGGAIYAESPISITSSTFTNNSAVNGGAIYSESSISVANSRFTNNNATAAIFANVLTVASSTFTNNRAVNGGAILAQSSIAVTSSRFTNNRAEYGGAVYAEGSISVASSTFTNNRASLGGAIYEGGGSSVTLTRNTFSVNRATGYGGAIFTNSVGDVLIGHSNKFTGNGASRRAGADVALGIGTPSLAIQQWQRLGARSVVIVRD